MPKKKKTIFKRILFPLLCLLFIQALTSFLAIIFSGTTKMLDKNAIHILDQTAENRKILFENHMIQQWSSLQEEAEGINTALNKMLKSRHLDMNQFFEQKELQEELLEKIADKTLFTLRKNSVTGVFVILADKTYNQNKAGSLSGIYFRDPDSLNNPFDFSDILMIRGSSKIGQMLKIPLDYLWTTHFFISPDMKDPQQNYFNKPFKAAKETPEIGYENLGYWSLPFCLEEDKEIDSYQMITYTVPLIYEDGTVYGVAGIDLSIDFIHDMMPSKEIQYEDGTQGGYMLVLRTQEDKLQILALHGAVAGQAGKAGDILTISETSSKGFYKVKGNAACPNQLYGTIHPLKLYNTNTPFYGDQWALFAVSNGNQLFHISKKLLYTFILAITVSLLFGMAVIYFIASLVTRPIRSLAQCIGNSRADCLTEFKLSDIKEIDNLYEVIYDLMKKQKQAEHNLLEEKGRYQAALECSKGTIFEYDAVKDTILFYHVSEDNKEREEVINNMSGCREILESGSLIALEDMSVVSDFFESTSEYKNYVFRAKKKDTDTSYIWVELKGKTIFNSSHSIYKIIGSLHDITQKKVEELKRQEQKKHDYLTGLYKRKEGIRLIKKYIDEGKTGYVILLDILHLYQINETLGMVTGDVVLEETGRILLSLLRPGDIALRFGGDEFLLWITSDNYNSTKDRVTAIFNLFENNYISKSLNLELKAGWTQSKGSEVPFQNLLQEAICALLTSKKKEYKSEPAVFYPDLTEKEKKLEVKMDDIFDEIAGIHYDSNLSIVSLILNMFDQNSGTKQIMPVILLKIGRYFRFTDIIMTLAEPDFYTNYTAFQWNDRGTGVSEQIRRYTEEVFHSCNYLIKDGPVFFKDSETELTAQQREFFGIGRHYSGICFALYINEKYAGSIAFLNQDKVQSMEEKNKNSLNEIVKIIATNLGKAKSDSASQAKSDFLSRMSHEIRTPMNAIIGMTQIAKLEDGLTEHLKDCLSKIEVSSEYLLSIINDILDMSKIESGKMKLFYSDFSIQKLLEDINTLILPQTEEKGIDFSIQAECSENQVIGDYLRIQQVILNLLSNALKFTQKKGKITLDLKQEIDSQNLANITVSVKDTGIGINEENISRIFHAFEQAEGDTSAKFGGTGLGLAISSSLVQMMGGKLKVESEEGSGSCFYFMISLEIANKDIKELREKEKPEYNFTGKRILLVEDNELNTEIAKTILEMNGFLVETAENGKAAVDQFMQSPQGYFDVILMDIRMPVMDGLEATKIIRNSKKADARTVFIVAMSANAFDEDMKKSIESGMDGHLVKPIDWNQMKELLGSLIFPQ